MQVYLSIEVLGDSKFSTFFKVVNYFEIRKALTFLLLKYVKLYMLFIDVWFYYEGHELSLDHKCTFFYLYITSLKYDFLYPIFREDGKLYDFL